MVDAKKIHLLLVDDDPIMLQLFGGNFARHGFEVIYGHNGAEGWEMARKFMPDVIVLDYRMDNMDGMELAERLRADDAGRGKPLIMLTNEDFSPDSVKALKEIGVDEYVHKGQDFAVIMLKLKAVLKKYGIEYAEPEKPY
jgi:DNA-binding response OmpR family regulator